MKKIIGVFLILLGISLFAFTAIKMAPKLKDYKETRDLYETIEDKYTKDPYKDLRRDSGKPGMWWEKIPIPFLKQNKETEVFLQNYESEYIPEEGETGFEKSLWDGTEYIPEEGETGFEKSILDETKEGISGTEERKKKYALKKRLEKDDKLSVLTEYFDKNRIDLNPAEFLPIEVDQEGLLADNPDYIGWIYVPNTVISYPVVLGKDNDEYLHTNFYKQYAYAGTIFMDAVCTDGILSHHGILYGHNMRDESMFYQTKNYIDQKFADEHPVFWMITPKYTLLYRIFSAYVADPYDEETYAVYGYDFHNTQEWEETVKAIKKKSAVHIDQDVDANSFVLTLSTCTNARTTRSVTNGVLIGALKHKEE